LQGQQREITQPVWRWWKLFGRNLKQEGKKKIKTIAILFTALMVMK